jgi:hypothetical protein
VKGKKGVGTFGSAAGSGVDARKGLGIAMAAESRNRCGMYCTSLLKSSLSISGLLVSNFLPKLRRWCCRNHRFPFSVRKIVAREDLETKHQEP